MTIKVVSNEEGEAADYVVCLRFADDPGYFADNLYAPCCACGQLVVYRPSAPKRPPRICVQCATAQTGHGLN